jgi:hypothetical protein
MELFMHTMNKTDDFFGKPVKEENFKGLSVYGGKKIKINFKDYILWMWNEEGHLPQQSFQ